MIGNPLYCFYKSLENKKSRTPHIINALLNASGEMQAERCIILNIREPFDYTKWQRTLWQDRSVREMSQAAMEYRKLQNSGE